MNSRILLICCLLFSALELHGQAIYSGQVRDLATRELISDVEVELIPGERVEWTNAGGDFLIKNSETDSLSFETNSYRFYSNAFVWEGSLALQLSFYSLDGTLLYEADSEPESGRFLIPRMPMGMYLIRVSGEAGTSSYRAFSDGDRTTSVALSSVWHRSSVPARNDTLIFSKEGYYDRRIPLQGRDTILQINLLAGENDELHYFNELIDPLAFDLISSNPARSNEAQVEAVKLIHNWDNDLMYYINSKRYDYHYTFAAAQLDFDQPNYYFNTTQYRNHEDRYLYCANLNYFKDLDRYVLHFVSANEIDCEQIERIYNKIVETSYMAGKLFLLVNRTEFAECGVPQISTEELYEGQNYQALNLTENYGYLQKVELAELEDRYLGRHDIVLLNGIPNDVSVVAGIITTEFQTPLSHINVLSHNRGTPNMALKDGWTNPMLQELLGELVYLNVRSDSFQIRKANLDEAMAFWEQNEPTEIIDLPVSIKLQELVDLNEADHSFINEIGGKAANFAELLKVRPEEGDIHTPEHSFAIPFYFYLKHMEDAGLDVFVEQMLNDPAFLNSPAVRKATLEELQDRIKDFPLDPNLRGMIEEGINYFEDFTSFRFRSSTNAEDLEDFSGAGLYSSHSAKKNHESKTIDAAVKKVWASLWNWRAFEERSYYKIKHSSCAMGVLVHRSFPDEDANGVLITKNIYNSNQGFIINVQHKDHSIVFPEPGVLHDQIILFAWSIIPGQDFMAEYLSFSNVEGMEGTVLTDLELQQLGAYCMAVKYHFFENVPHTHGGSFGSFGLDIEFKVDSTVEGRRIYLKQVRAYR